MNDALRELKHGTQAHHAEAERHVQILDDAATVATYERYLRRMLGFHAPMEERFARHAELEALGFDAAARRKQQLLRADLVTLGSVTPEVYCRALHDTADLASAIGAAYVIESATLGGRFILRRLPARLRHLSGVATAFLEGYGAATGAMWRRFAAVAHQGLSDAAARQRAIESAQATFMRLTTWLDEPAAPAPRPFRALHRLRSSEARS
ncbi:MAG TPA: biliverdin-producing heme oxygenase [Kofleriaceae bacterium]|nr:biliverdin-producing heme oxygenase [Kofleriaceae bacterium]